MTDYEHLIYQRRGPVTIITINRPERMNAIGPQTHRELIDAWDRFRVDDTALVGVLTGAGDKAFCAGGDLKAASAGELIDPSAAESSRDATEKVTCH
jgi:enoyl-CoA hydratase